MSGASDAASPGAAAGRLRFALAGCGDFGKHLAGYAVEQAELASLCDPDAGNLAATAAELDSGVPGVWRLPGAATASDWMRCW